MGEDNTGNIYVGEWSAGNVFKYSAAGALLWTAAIGTSSSL